MSLDVFLQGFRNGNSFSGDGAKVRNALDPFIADSGDTWANLTTSDGDAEVYGFDDLSTGLMFTHISGRAIWDVVFDVAVAGGFVVIPIGCPVGVLHDGDVEHLPASLVEDAGVVVVSTGDDLRRLVEDGRPIRTTGIPLERKPELSRVLARIAEHRRADRAGAALSRPASSGGLAGVLSFRQRRRASQVAVATSVGVLVLVLVLVGGGLVLRTTLDGPSPQVVSDTSRVESTAVSTTTEPPSLPSSTVDVSRDTSGSGVAEGRFGGPLRDEGCDWVLEPTPGFIGVSLETTGAGGQGSRSFFAGSVDDDVWVNGDSVCGSVAIVAVGGVRDDVTRVVVRSPDGNEITLEIFDVPGKPWNAVLGEYPGTWFDLLDQTGEIVLFAGDEVVVREPYQLLGINNPTAFPVPPTD